MRDDTHPMHQPMRPPMRPPSSVVTRRGAGKPALLIAIAISLMLASAAILLSRGSSSNAGAATPIDEADIPDITGPVGDVPDIRDGGGIGPARNAVVKLKDRNAPARIAWEIEFAALEPATTEDIVDIERPRAWYFVGQNQAVFIRADAAEFVMPDISSEPESGRFTGNVELLQLDRRPDGSLPEPLPELSAVRITTDWLDFDAVAGELSTTELVTVLSQRVEAECQGVRLVLNEVDQRLEYFEVPGTLVATLLPEVNGDESAEPAAPSDDPEPAGSSRPSTATAESSAQPLATPEPADEQFYAAVFQGGVEVTQPMRRLDADRALAWLTLTDNRFDTDRLSRAAPLRRDDAQPAPWMPLEATLVAMAMASHGQPEGVETDNMGFDEPMRFVCQGPTVIRPLEGRPVELSGDEVLTLRFEAEPDARVTFTDDALPAEGDADAIEYAFADKLLTLIGGAASPSRTTIVETGTLVAETVSIGLATGVGQATGAGVLTDATGDRSVAWRDQADVVFRVENGWMTGSIEQAVAAGSVLLLDGSTRISASDANARFAKADESAVIERAVLTGDVRATTSRGSLSADRVDVRFLVEGEQSSPHLAIATGSVVGEQRGQRVAAHQIEADLTPEPSANEESNTQNGDVRVTAARATGEVRYTRDNGTFAEGDSVSVDADARTVRVSGSPGAVGTGSATVEGERIMLDEVNATIEVPGRGRLTLTDDSHERALVVASWTDSMRFSDITGELAADGDVQIIATPNEFRRDTVRGSTVLAVVEPLDEQADANNADTPLGDRRLVSAVATSSDTERLASAEILRFAAGADQNTDAPERVILLLGQHIDADNAAGILRSPGAGRLLVSDRRLEPSATSDDDAFRGSALFDWDGSMTFDRAAGTATMERRVRLVHRPGEPDRGTVELECEKLIAAFDADPGVRLTDASRDAQVSTVDATGAVWARSGEQQILADTLVYEPGTGRANAQAAPGGWVTLFDPQQVAPVTAARLIWDVDDGRIEVVRPSPVSVPR